ncbi:helix-turn-helix domain-containing protein [Pseudomonas sp. 8O]|uniref:helix-turn-helix domain-containing protein n=1 Tax=Pseudomonas sp. 8O TaxID=2653165 RepID=UPI0012F13739|nr:AraC family transcriptional regulator [Pseudomonas sp. 8O]VXC40958.1 AraC family transcriptional regulator [Pseudomonas sp. 8O]
MKWNGKVTFGKDWLGYVGLNDESSPHVHVAIQLCVGLQYGVRVALDDGILEGDGVIIGPGVRHHALVSTGRMALLFLYPDAPLGRALHRQLGSRGTAVASQAITHCIRHAATLEQAVVALQQCLVSAQAFDPRLSNILDLLRADCSGVGAVSRAASTAGISRPRLRHVAHSQMGVPLSQWIIWRKLERSCRALALEASLSDAAMQGGFADQAHLTRMMRRMIGLSPGRVALILRKTSDSFNNPR